MTTCWAICTMRDENENIVIFLNQNHAQNMSFVLLISENPISCLHLMDEKNGLVKDLIYTIKTTSETSPLLKATELAVEADHILKEKSRHVPEQHLFIYLLSYGTSWAHLSLCCALTKRAQRILQTWYVNLGLLFLTSDINLLYRNTE